jgi:hypothetical protein
MAIWTKENSLRGLCDLRGKPADRAKPLAFSPTPVFQAEGRSAVSNAPLGAATRSHRSSSYSLTTGCLPRYRYSQEEGLVSRGVRTFVLLLLTAIAGVSAIPQTDRPETCYDETDTPLNQVLPEAMAIRFARPANVVNVRPKTTREADRNVPVHDMLLTAAHARRDSRSLQDLFCTLLI